MDKWELFAKAAEEGLTLRAIRAKLLIEGYDLSDYDDVYLICKMIEIHRK